MIINLETFLAAAEESSSGLELLLPATSELFAGIFAFDIVFFFVWKWALPALDETLSARAEAIEGQISKAKNEKYEAQKTREDYQKLVSNADEEVRKMYMSRMRDFDTSDVGILNESIFANRQKDENKMKSSIREKDASWRFSKLNGLKFLQWLDSLPNGQANRAMKEMYLYASSQSEKSSVHYKIY